MALVVHYGPKWLKVENQSNPVSVEAPRGFHQARVDEKGRLKLPAALHKYLNELGEGKVFITTLDLRTARLYPISVWRHNEKVLADAGANSKAATRLSFLANHYGADSELDPQGRVLISKELRQELRVENEPVWLLCEKGRIEMYSKAVYEDTLAIAKAGAVESLEQMTELGLA